MQGSAPIKPLRVGGPHEQFCQVEDGEIKRQEGQQKVRGRRNSRSESGKAPGHAEKKNSTTNQITPWNTAFPSDRGETPGKGPVKVPSDSATGIPDIPLQKGEKVLRKGKGH